MAKRRQGACSKEDSMCRDQFRSNDRISMLPDELLVFILSFLTVKEASSTSIFSRRWRYLWTLIYRLDFDGTDSLLKVNFSKGKWRLVLYEERSNYVRWVNHVISLHKNCTIEEFRIFFNLTKIHEKSIDKWLKYALDRKVERLELNLTNDACCRNRIYKECYTFPYELFGKISTGKCVSFGFKYLKKISMNYVNVTGEALQFFLCNCPLLEDLSVSQSGELTTLKIIGPFPSLKRLEITFCRKLNLVEIRDANLIYLKYKGSTTHFLLENVPLLVEIFTDGSIKNILSMFSSNLPQLEIFTVDNLIFSWDLEETKMLYSTVKMSNLKQLVVKVHAVDDSSFLPLTNLIRASPCLQKFVLEVWYGEPNFVKREIKKIVRSYPRLKEVKFVGYRGVTGDLELIMHFLENAKSLEKILIDPTKPCMSTYRYELRYKGEFKDEIIKDEMEARTRAKNQLTEIVPPRINLEIL